MFVVRLAGICALVATIGIASAAEWTTRTFATDGFAAEFSGDVETRPMDVTKAARKQLVRATIYTQMNERGTRGFLVSANRFADDEPINVSAIARRTMKSYDCKDIVQDNRIDVDGVSAREMRATGCFQGTDLGARFFKRDQWLYQVIYLIQNEADRDDGEHFLASFKLVPIVE